MHDIGASLGVRDDLVKRRKIQRVQILGVGEFVRILARRRFFPDKGDKGKVFHHVRVRKGRFFVSHAHPCKKNSAYFNI